MPPTPTLHPTGIARAPVVRRSATGEDGSIVTEYGLLAILGATIAGLAIKWAAGGAIFGFFGSILAKVKALAGV